MTKDERKLLNDVAHVLKALYTIDPDTTKLKVDYQIFNLRAYIHWRPQITSTGNGHERYFNWGIIDALKEISDSKGISYKVGLTDSLELNIQIYI